MFLLGVDTVTADAQSIERRNAEGAGEVSIAAAPELSVSEGESDIPRDAPGNVIEFFRRLLHGEQGTDGAASTTRRTSGSGEVSDDIFRCTSAKASGVGATQSTSA